MKRIPVISSNIKSVGFEPAPLVEGQSVQLGTMEVEFNQGTVYQYTGVPQEIYETFKLVESKGKYFYAVIKGKFPYVKVDLAKTVHAGGGDGLLPKANEHTEEKVA